MLTTTTLGAMSALGGVSYAFHTVGYSFGSNSQSNSPGKHGSLSWGTSNGYGGPSSNCQYGDRDHHHHDGHDDGGNYGGGGFGW
ncbi:MAG: hypothetical protein ACTHNU_06530 [Gaiellales bacterium]